MLTTLSIIIPTFNEAENVHVIVERITSALKTVQHEIIFVDDSKDDTPKVLASLAEEYSSVKFEHRDSARGLGTAVVRGFELAKGDVVTVMDADLQHPPEMLLSMLTHIESGADIVIPSRFVPGGDDGGLRWHRKLVSWVARWMSKVALASVRKVNDPTSGFFMFRRCIIEGVKLKPIGWKILIEILVRGNYDKVAEIPYRFHARNAGTSKMSGAEQLKYITHLFKLMVESPRDRRFYLFAVVGVSGVVINMIIYNFLVQMNWIVVLAGVASGFCAMISNFIMNDLVTWSDSRSGKWHVRALKYGVTSVVGIGINAIVLWLAYNQGHLHYLVSNLLGIAIATLWNYTVNNLWTWRFQKHSAVKDIATR